MLPEAYRWIVEGFEPEGDPWLLRQAARDLLAAGHLAGAATAYDRAFGIAPDEETIARERGELLDRLAVTEHGLRFRYIPAGPFLMGSRDGDPDEAPVHPVWLSAYWLSDTPVSWADYCARMGWALPPDGQPSDADAEPEQMAWFHLHEMNKIRLQYCEDETAHARDWHAHMPGQLWEGAGGTQTAQELFGAPQRDHPDAPWTYATKPMVAVGWQEAQELADRLTTPGVRYCLPGEAQWEKAARGGRIGARYAWGDEPPTAERCDFNHFAAFAIRPMRSLPANDYGLYAMCGGVWEWTRDWYDRDAYHHAADRDPEGSPEGKEKALRGGSWADGADAVTVTFRMSRGSVSWRRAKWGEQRTPTIGFRLCRLSVGGPS